MSPTQQQQAAIEARGQSLLLSAGAGAGKTRTLIDRILGLLVDSGCRASIDSLLIVTFTRAATAEMRERLAHSLHERLEAARAQGHAEDADWLEDQIALLPRARISTIHGFCNTLLQENADIAGLPPDFEIAPEEEARLQRLGWTEEAVEEILGEDSADGEALRGLFRQMAPVGARDNLVQMSMLLQDYLEGLADPRAVAEDRFLRPYDEAADASLALDDTAFGRWCRDFMRDVVEDFAEPLEQLFDSEATRGMPAGGKVEAFVSDVRAAIDAARTRIASLPVDEPFETWAKTVAMPTTPRRNAKGISEREAAWLELLWKPIKKAADGRGKRWDKLGKGESLQAHRRRFADLATAARVLVVRLGLDLSDTVLDRCVAQRWVTFSQLERLALRLLVAPGGAPTPAAEAVRARFAHVFVDEFQDVNPLQAALLRAVSRPASADAGGNLFVVGDVKQSIYGFRHADPTQFLDLLGSYRDYDPARPSDPGARILLLENFRSAPPLIHALNAFFEPIFRAEVGGVAYDASHQFIAGRDEPPPGPPRIDIRLLERVAAADSGDGEADDSDHDGHDDDSGEHDASARSEEVEVDAAAEEQEAWEAVRAIQQARDDGHAYGDIAILLRSARVVAARFAEVLRSAGIPLQTEENLGFLLQQEVLDTICLLRVIDNPYSDAALVGALRGPAGEWSADDLAALRGINRGARLFDNLRRAGRDYESPLRAPSAAFLARLEQWQEAARHLPMARLFTRLYDDLGLRERAAVLPGGDQRRRNLQHLLDRAEQFDAFRRKGLGLFLAFLDDLLERGQDLGQPGAIDPARDAVRLLTMHKSKGLEFPVVVLPMLGRAFNRMSLNGPLVLDEHAGLALRFEMGTRFGDERVHLAPDLLRKRLASNQLSEEMRLLYVAMTRAKERLVLVASSPAMPDLMRAAARRAEFSDAPSLRQLQQAKGFLDWILAAVVRRGEFRRLLPGPEEPFAAEPPVEPGDLFVVRGPIRSAPPDSAGDRGPRWAEERLAEHQPEIAALLEQVRRAVDRPPDARVRAKVSVSEAKRAADSLHSEFNRPRRWTPRSRRAPGDPPAWASERLFQRAGLGPMAFGTLVHRFYALVDLDALAQGASVEGEVARLAAGGFFSAEEAALLDPAMLRGFLEDDLGQRLLASRATARREEPFTLGAPASEFDPAAAPDGLVVVQGVADLLFLDRQPSGRERLVLVDYKTDRWNGTVDDLDRLREAYAPQVKIYCAGVQGLLGRPVDEAWLYFLRAPQAMPVDPPASQAEWIGLLRAAAAGGGGLEG